MSIRDGELKKIEETYKDFCEFSDWVQENLDRFNKGCIKEGRIGDPFGGDLFYAHRSGSPSSAHIDKLLERFFREDERETVRPLLIKACENYSCRISAKIGQALHDLTIEMLAPAFATVGKKYQAHVNDHTGKIVTEETLEGGILVRRPYKGEQLLFSSKKDLLRFQLIRVLEAAATRIYPTAITIPKLTDTINKHFRVKTGEVDRLPGSWPRGPYVETSEPFTPDSLEGQMRSCGIRWKEEKKRIKDELDQRAKRKNPIKRQI